MQRQPKQAGLETVALHSLLLDEPPALEVSNANMGPNGVRNILAVHDSPCCCFVYVGRCPFGKTQVTQHETYGFLDPALRSGERAASTNGVGNSGSGQAHLDLRVCVST